MNNLYNVFVADAAADADADAFFVVVFSSLIFFHSKFWLVVLENAQVLIIMNQSIMVSKTGSHKMSLRCFAVFM